MGTAQRRAVPVALRGRHRTNPEPRGRIDHDGRFGAPLADPGQSGPRAQAGDRHHHVHGLSAERCQRDHAAAQAFAERRPLRAQGQGQFHRRRWREHRVRPGRHGADPERHLAQSRHRRRRAGAQSFGARFAAGRDAQCHPFRPRLFRGRERQAGAEEAADGALCARLFAAHLRLWRIDAALRRQAEARRRLLLADVRVSLGDDARAARAA